MLNHSDILLLEGSRVIMMIIDITIHKLDLKIFNDETDSRDS